MIKRVLFAVTVITFQRTSYVVGMPVLPFANDRLAAAKSVREKIHGMLVQEEIGRYCASTGKRSKP